MKSKTKASNTARSNRVEPEFRLGPESLRRIPRKHRASSEETAPRNCKVRVTMYLDGDIVKHFKDQAARPNAAAYQTQINSALRSLLENGPQSSADRLLNDDRFIDAVARRVTARRPEAA